MYLQIGGSRYSVRRRIVYEDAVAYLSVTPEPVEGAGMIQLCRDDGFVLAEDDAGAYARHTYAGTRLTLTNAAEVSPIGMVASDLSVFEGLPGSVDVTFDFAA